MKPATGQARKPDVTHGSGNVFTDLGFGGEAAELQVKAELTRQLHNRIKLLKLTQTDASKRLGISQPDVSKLMNGRHTGFSIDRLIDIAQWAGSGRGNHPAPSQKTEFIRRTYFGEAVDGGLTQNGSFGRYGVTWLCPRKLSDYLRVTRPLAPGNCSD